MTDWLDSVYLENGKISNFNKFNEFTFLIKRIAVLCWFVNWTHRGSSSSSVILKKTKNKKNTNKNCWKCFCNKLFYNVFWSAILIYSRATGIKMSNILTNVELLIYLYRYSSILLFLFCFYLFFFFLAYFLVIE